MPPVIRNDGSIWYSTWATSGPPRLAWITARSLTYSVEPPPTLTRSTWMFGYFCSKSFTSASIPGTQDQRVRVVGVCIALSIMA